MPRLVITKGPGLGRDHAITTECVVGRGDADFVIEDHGSSRRHCRILVDGDGYAIEDLGSRNGTFVDGTRIQRAPLRDGALVRIGQTEFVFRQKGLVGPVTAPAAKGIAVPPVIAVPPAVAVPPAIPKPPAIVPPRVATPPVVARPPAAPAPAAPSRPEAAPATEPAPPKPIVAPTPARRRRGGAW